MSEQTTPSPVEYHWLATIQIGPRQITKDGIVNAVPGMHTRQSTMMAVLDSLSAEYEPGFTVIFFSLEPNAIPQAVAA